MRLDVFRLTAKSNVPRVNPPEAAHWAGVMASRAASAIPLVSMLPIGEVVQARVDVFQYFQLVRPSKETRYFKVVPVGVVCVVTTPLILLNVSVSRWQ